MKNSIVFDFSVDTENKVIRVEREFAAPLSQVWDAWTKSELLDQWWAPKPWKAVTKEMNFREGGYWLYAMVGPDNTKQFCRNDYTEIVTHKSIAGYDAFCDESGKITMDFPRSLWINRFTEEGDSTFVNITIEYETIADLQKYIDMGFREGFTAGLENLDALLREME